MSATPQKHLYLHLGSDRNHQSFVRRQYVTYPFRLSRPLRLDPIDQKRAYLYVMNTSPGLLAGDSLGVSLQLDANTSLYLTDQSATKVHSMPNGAAAKTFYEIGLAAGANLEFVPEPLILYTDSTLEQTTQVTLHSTSQLFLSEVMLPGRLARGEFYCFRHYFSRIRVAAATGELLFTDAMRLEGKLNPFKGSRIFSALPAIANIIVVLPGINLKQLTTEIEAVTAADQIVVGFSALPNCNGLLVRAIAESANLLKIYIRHALNCVRQVSNQPPLPEIPK